MAEGITLSGQLAVRWVAADINKFLNRACGTDNVDYVIYCDTDSVGGDTLVYANGEQVTIESLYERFNVFVKKDEIKQDFVKPVTLITTLSVNTKTGKVEEKPIKYIMKHRVKKVMYKITSPSGKSVTVTADHSIIVSRGGKIIDVSPADLRKTDKIINILTQPEYQYNGIKGSKTSQSSS